jgi:hypothetical protein
MVRRSTLGVKALAKARVASIRLVAVTPRVVESRAAGFHLDNLRWVPLSGRGPSLGAPGFPAKVRGFNNLWRAVRVALWLMNFKNKPYKASMWMLRLVILLWRTIYNVGQYRDDIVYLAPISYYGATNTLRAFL